MVSRLARRLTGVASLSFTAEQALNEALYTESSDFDGRLYQYNDPVGLNRLHSHYGEMEGAFWSLEFSVENYDVIIRADGTVNIQ